MCEIKKRGDGMSRKDGKPTRKELIETINSLVDYTTSGRSNRTGNRFNADEVVSAMGVMARLQGVTKLSQVEIVRRDGSVSGGKLRDRRSVNNGIIELGGRIVCVGVEYTDYEIKMSRKQTQALVDRIPFVRRWDGGERIRVYFHERRNNRLTECGL